MTEFPKFSSRFRSPLLSQLTKGFGTAIGLTRIIAFFVLPCEMTNRECFPECCDRCFVWSNSGRGPAEWERWLVSAASPLIIGNMIWTRSSESRGGWVGKRGTNFERHGEHEHRLHRFGQQPGGSARLLRPRDSSAARASAHRRNTE